VRGYEVARIRGIPIRVNASLPVFLPILAWLIASGGRIQLYAGVIGSLSGVALDPAPLRVGLTPWIIGLAAALGLLVGVTLHELGHSWVALRYGIGIESITLWILGGLASLESMPKEWDREFWIAITGPVTSVAVAAVCYAGLLAVPPSLSAVRFVVGWLAITNLVLASFNLLPAFPMDGGRILRALLARTDRTRVRPVSPGGSAWCSRSRSASSVRSRSASSSSCSRGSSTAWRRPSPGRWSSTNCWRASPSLT